MDEISIALAMGGNVGDVPKAFLTAARALRQAGVNQIKLSSFYRTAPVGCAAGIPDFINAVMTGKWSGTVFELHELCKKIEEQSGRPRNHEHYGSRTLDLDIIFFGDAEIATPGLTIPHREAANRLFVLVPLAEIAGDWRFPGRNESVSDILSTFKETDEYRVFQSDSHPELFSFY